MNLLFLETLGYESALRISGHHYARIAAERGHRVLSISAPVTPFHRLARGDASVARRFENRRRGFVPAPGSPAGNPVLHWVPGAWFPVRRGTPFDSPIATRLSAIAWRGELRRRLAALDFSPDVLFLQNLLFLPLFDEFPRAATIYRMVDLMSAFDDFPRSLAAAEARALAESDLIVVSATELLDRVEPSRRGKTIVARNGVDLARFAAPAPRPDAYAGIDRPIVLYVGALRAWFDWGLFGALVERLPEFRFVVVSPDRPPDGAIDPAKATYIPGVPYEEIPALYLHAAVGIIPFRDCDLVRRVSPIKLFECLATGTPVVSLDWPELRAMNAPATLARDADEFVEGIRKSAASPRADHSAFLASHSWEGNFEAMTARALPIVEARRRRLDGESTTAPR